MSTVAKEPDVRAAVAALLAQGWQPGDVEKSIVHELQRQTAGLWGRHHGGMGWGGDWYTLSTPTAAKAERAMVQRDKQLTLIGD